MKPQHLQLKLQFFELIRPYCPDEQMIGQLWEEIEGCYHAFERAYHNLITLII